MKNSFKYLLVAIALLILILCFNKSKDDTVTASIDPIGTLYPLRVADATIKIKVAVNEKEQQMGLMHITSLPSDDGMIFPYQVPRKMSFWMKNTQIPLDIAYITADGIIREIHPLYPRDEASVSSYRDDIKYALEANQNWFKNNGIKIGSSIDLNDLETSLKARGFYNSDSNSKR